MRWNLYNAKGDLVGLYKYCTQMKFEVRFGSIDECTVTDTMSTNEKYMTKEKCGSDIYESA